MKLKIIFEEPTHEHLVIRDVLFFEVNENSGKIKSVMTWKESY